VTTKSKKHAYDLVDVAPTGPQAERVDVQALVNLVNEAESRLAKLVRETESRLASELNESFEPANPSRPIIEPTRERMMQLWHELRRFGPLTTADTGYVGLSGHSLAPVATAYFNPGSTQQAVCSGPQELAHASTPDTNLRSESSGSLSSYELLGGKRLLKHRPTSRAEQHAVIVKGMQYAVLFYLTDHCAALSEVDIANVMGVSTRTLRRQKDDPKKAMPVDLF
jgi:hypothetical protein